MCKVCTECFVKGLEYVSIWDPCVTADVPKLSLQTKPKVDVVETAHTQAQVATTEGDQRPSPSASWDVCEHKRTPDERLKVNQSSPTSAAVYYLLPGVRVWSFEKMPLTCLGKSCNGMRPAGAEEWNSRRSQAATFLPRRQQAPALNFQPLTGC